MTHNESLQTVTEGTTSILVYGKKETIKGPGVKHRFPFYNPAMELNRDLSVVLMQWFLSKKQKKIEILDGLASSGIRGVRFAHELNGDFNVTINDVSPDAYALIKKNIIENQINNAVAANENVHSLLSKHKYDYVDIDPFGSPAGFIDSAVRGIYHEGIIACTATDTAALCGVYPKVCKRRYAALPLHGVAMHEVGLRILLGYLGRVAATYDKGIRPILCHSTDHYMRVYVQILNNLPSANETVDHISSVSNSIIHPFLNIKKDKPVGPLWIGSLHNTTAVQEIKEILSAMIVERKHEISTLLEIMEKEADATAFFYTTDMLASHFHVSPPSREDLFNLFRKKGYTICRTQFSPTGFKTNAASDIIKSLYLSVSKKNM